MQQGVESDVILDNGFDGAAEGEHEVLKRVVWAEDVAVFHGEVTLMGQPRILLQDVQSTATQSQHLTDNTMFIIPMTSDELATQSQHLTDKTMSIVPMTPNEVPSILLIHNEMSIVLCTECSHKILALNTNKIMSAVSITHNE